MKYTSKTPLQFIGQLNFSGYIYILDELTVLLKIAISYILFLLWGIVGMVSGITALLLNRSSINSSSSSPVGV